MNRATCIPEEAPATAQLVETMSVGGAENLAVGISNELAERGHRSHLIVMTEPGPLSCRVAPGVRQHFLGFRRPSVKNPFAFLAATASARHRLSRIVAEHDVSNLQSHLPGANFLGLALSYGSSVRVWPTVHNNREFDYGDADDRVRRGMRVWAYRRMLHRCTGIIAVSEAVKASLVDELDASSAAARRIHVVTNGVPVVSPPAASEVIEVRRRFGIGPEEPFVIGAGRLCEQKNFTDLVSVAALVRSQSPTARFLIAGDGELREELEEQIRSSGLEDTVILAGNIPDLERVFSAADVFLTTSLWEGLPLVLLEAMATGLAPVGYAIDGVNEVLGGSGAGQTVPVGDLGGLASAVTALLECRERAAAMGASARKLVEMRYSFARAVSDLERLYDAS